MSILNNLYDQNGNKLIRSKNYCSYIIKSLSNSFNCNGSITKKKLKEKEKGQQKQQQQQTIKLIPKRNNYCFYFHTIFKLRLIYGFKYFYYINYKSNKYKM